PDGVDLMGRYGIAGSSMRYLVYNAQAERLERTVPYLRLRYEDFVSDPQSCVTRVLGFAGVAGGSAGPFVGDKTVDLSPTHTVDGNPTRFLQGPTQIKMDGEWRERMDARKRLAATAMTLPLLRKYGYLTRTPT